MGLEGFKREQKGGTEGGDAGLGGVELIRWEQECQNGGKEEERGE